MRILNFGSMNLDFVYEVEGIVRPGETVRALSRRTYCGGKGLNQSVALARAGADVCHAGLIGTDGAPLLALLQENGVDVSRVEQTEGLSSHTVIQVDKRGQNCILFYADGLLRVTDALQEHALEGFGPGDWLLVQNELERMGPLLRAAKARGMKTALNPSPANDSLRELPLGSVDCFLLNEVEGGWLTGETEPEAILQRLRAQYPEAVTVLTLGEAGSVCAAGTEIFRQKAYPADAVDTTAAGDTFTGYFLAGLLRGEPLPRCLDRASRAAAIAVSRPGAAPSIPFARELKE